MSARTDTKYFDGLWSQVLAMMKERLSGPTFETWFEGTKILKYDAANHSLFIYTPTPFVKNWIEEHYTNTIQNMIIALTEQEYRIQFVTDWSEERQDTL